MIGQEQKRCFKCGEIKLRSEFYAHPRMGDGLLGKCKSCTKNDVAARYLMSRDKIREYERNRFLRPERKAMLLKYQRASRVRNSGKWFARNAVSNAIRDGRIRREPCKMCGDPKVQAHHGDYSKPLDIEWLCFRCHREERHGQVVGTTESSVTTF